MNIETANRLAELRKKAGLSQEELADKLGLSRQAVSKWERAESSPDTDNLILLAKLYNVSLDELLKTDKPVDEIIKDNKENINENEESVEAEFVGIDDDNDEEVNKKKHRKDKVYIGPDGIHVESEDGDTVHVGPSGISVNDGEFKKDSNYGFINEKKKRKKIVGLLNGLFFGVATLTYIMLGLFWKAYCPMTNQNNAGWAAGWIVFILAPIIPSIVDAILSKRASKVNFLFMGLSAYLFIGMMTPNGWHPWWCLILIGLAINIIIKSIERFVFDTKRFYKWKDTNDDVNVENKEEDD